MKLILASCFFSVAMIMALVVHAHAAASEGEGCGCKVTVEEVHLVDGDMCPENEVMVGHPSHEHEDHHQVACGKVVCHCSCHPQD